MRDIDRRRTGVARARTVGALPPPASGERRDLALRPLCDAVATWFELHPSELARLDRSTVRTMASRLETAETVGRVIEIGEFRMDLRAQTLHVAGRWVFLTGGELDVLALLLSPVGAVHSRASISDQIRGTEPERHDEAVSVHIRRLRARLRSIPKVPLRIRTVRGRGYRVELIEGHGR